MGSLVRHEQGSTGAVAKLLRAEVVLVIDCSKADPFL